MAKRTIDEVEVETHANGATEAIEKKKTKKEKKDKKDKKPKVVDGEVEGATQVEEDSKREKKEKKSKKKDKRNKADKSGKEAAQDEDVDNVPKAVEENGEENGDSIRKSKEERKAAKKAAKAAEKFAKVSLSDDISMTHESSAKAFGISTPATAISQSASSVISGSYTEHPELTALPQSTVDDYLKEAFISFTDSTKASKLRPITKFTYVPIEDETQRKSFLKFTSGFAAPTPIQAAVWPYLLSGRDCIGVAETGSGKTLAFGVPAIRRVLALPNKERRGVKVLVVSPTRELAMQSHEHLEKMARDDGLTAVCVYGGVPKDEQRRLLRKATIVVATPGRLNDLIQEGAADLSKVDYLVLDEADRMLDKGMYPLGCPCFQLLTSI